MHAQDAGDRRQEASDERGKDLRCWPSSRLHEEWRDHSARVHGSDYEVSEDRQCLSAEGRSRGREVGFHLAGDVSLEETGMPCKTWGSGWHGWRGGTS